jgi:hypothetical protein
MKQFVSGEKVSEWAANKILQAKRWVGMVSHFSKNHFPFSEVLKLAVFFFCLPGTSVATERVFSHMDE